MYDNDARSVPEGIVSISWPYIRPIVRGRARINLSINGNGVAKIEKQSFDLYNESDVLIEAIGRYYKRTGHYLERVLTYKIYWNCKNPEYCKEHGSVCPVLHSGGRKKEPLEDQNLIYIAATNCIK